MWPWTHTNAVDDLHDDSWEQAAGSAGTHSSRGALSQKMLGKIWNLRGDYAPREDVLPLVPWCHSVVLWGWSCCQETKWTCSELPPRPRRENKPTVLSPSGLGAKARGDVHFHYCMHLLKQWTWIQYFYISLTSFIKVNWINRGAKNRIVLPVPKHILFRDTDSCWHGPAGIASVC